MKKLPAIFACVSITALLLPATAHAMHIADGVLPIGWAGIWYLAAAPFVLVALYRLRGLGHLRPGIKPLLGVMGAAVFVVSCLPIPVPTAGTCSHMAGTAMAAILIGPFMSALAAMAALLLQAVFLSDGGLSTLGANVFSMGIAGSFTGYLVFRGLRGLKSPVFVAAFLAGMLGDWTTYAVTSFQLASALHGDGALSRYFMSILAAFVPTQLPLGILEGFITAGAVKFLHGRRPEILECGRKGVTTAVREREA